MIRNKKIILTKNIQIHLLNKQKRKPQETLEFILLNQKEAFSFSPSINLSEEGKWLVAVTSFETTKSFSITTAENSSFLTSARSYWTLEGGEELINELKKILLLRSRNDFELHVKEVNKRGSRIKIENGGYILAGFDKKNWQK